MSRLRDVIPWLRARRAGWSSETDRAFHDKLFASQSHDAFSPAYTGNITIRRFADLAAPRVAGAGHVLDIGCGLAEITCELARRFPDTGFAGVDHSEAGIAGGRRNAERLGLENVRLEVADMESFEPAGPVDLVTMFDSFHHLVDPRAFIERMGRYTRRFLLIEPQGDWKGSWLRELDADWLAADLEKIRARWALVAGEGAAAPAAGHEPNPPPAASSETRATPPPGAGPAAGREVEEPVENRYSIDAFEEMFAGYGVSFRGTVSGLDEYPPDPTLDTPSRREFGDISYGLYAALDQRLFDNDLDLYAKHLVVYAERGASAPRRKPAPRPPSLRAVGDLRGPHDVEYLEYDGPQEARPGDALEARVRLRNNGFRALTSNDPEHPDHASYHWLDASGNVVVADGERSALPGDVAPDQEVDVVLRIVAPRPAGDYVLAVDLVQEGKAWFSDAGSPALEIPFRVKG